MIPLPAVILLACSVVMLLGGLIALALGWGSKDPSKTKAGGNVVAEEVPEEEPQARAGRRPVRGMRHRGARRGPQAPAAVPAGGEGDPEASEGSEDEDAGPAEGRKGRKKQERAARREAQTAARGAKQEKLERQAEARQAKDAAREEEERRQAADEAARLKAEAAAAEEEYSKWKDMFTTDTAGSVEQESQEESQGLLQEFVDYIKKHKCVLLEELAAAFGLRTQDVIQRVQALESMGRITGVMDDRGKFIYISLEEMEAVASYIKKVGRVSIAHLASKSNEFIDLEVKETPVIEIDFGAFQNEIEGFEEGLNGEEIPVIGK